MSEEGYTYSYRKKWQNPIFRNLLEAAIWSWMCDTAAWKETKVRFAGELIEIKRGQLVTSVRFLSQGFGIGEQVTRTFVENLKKDGMLNTQPTHKGTIITICNYDKYQSISKADNTQTNKQLTNSQHTANTNKKEDNKIKEVKKEVSSRGSRFALDHPPPDWIQFCQTQRPELNAGIIFDSFRDYWLAIPGRRGCKLDWTATWRNWIRNQKQEPKNEGFTNTKSKFQQGIEGIAAARFKRMPAEPGQAG